jgi:hypothetical protein
MKEYGTTVDWRQEKIEYPKTNLSEWQFVHKKSHILAWKRTRTSEVSGQRIKVWAMARPYDDDEEEEEEEEEEKE